MTQVSYSSTTAKEAAGLEISGIADATPQTSEAKALVLTGQMSQAEYLLETVLNENPAHCDAWHALGHARRLQGKTQEALEAYSHAIEVAYRYHSIIHFEHSALCLQRALLNYAMGEDEKAKADITQAIFQDHSNAPALLIQKQGWQRGMTLPDYTSNHITALACEQEIRRAPLKLEQLPDYQQQHDKAIYYWRHGQNEHAIGILSTVLKTHADYALAWHHRGLIFLEMGDSRQAHADFSQGIEAGGKWHRNYHQGAALHHLHRGQIQHQMGGDDMAMIDYRKAIDIDRNQAQARASIALLYHERGQMPTAIAELKQALTLSPREDWQAQLQQWEAGLRG